MFGSDSTGMLHVKLFYDRETGRGELTVRPQPASTPPAALRPVVDLLTALGEGNRLELDVGHPVQATIGMGIDSDDTLLPTGFAQLTQVLEALQERARTSFAIPEDLTEEEVREIMEYAQELRPAGRRFTWEQIDLTLNRLPDDPAQDRLLSQEGGSLMFTGVEIWEFRGRTYELGMRRIIWDQAVVEHAEAVGRRLQQAGRSPIRLRPGPQSRGAVARILDPDDPTLGGEPRS